MSHPTQTPSGRYWMLIAVATLLVLAACGCRQDESTELATRPATDAADFVKTGAEPTDNARLYIGLAGNGVFLGRSGDAPLPPAGPNSAMPIVFGDFWDRTERRALLAFGFAPQAVADDAYWQTLDVDTGMATTHWRSRGSLGRRGDVRVESVVTPGGTCCWRVRSSGIRPELRICAPTLNRDAWHVAADTAEATVRTCEFAGTITARVLPTPDWRFVGDREASGRPVELTTPLGPDAFVSVAQSAKPVTVGGADTVVADVPYQSFNDAARATSDFWQDFWSRSSVAVPDADLMKWYRRSLYYLGAMSANSTYPPGPMGSSPVRWGGRIFGHDTTYMHYALLTSNHPDIAKGYVDWYLSVLPAAKDHASSKCDLPGARFGWEQNWRGEEICGAVYADEHHVNADIASQAYMQALWTGDADLTEEIKPLVRETATFLAAHLQWDEGLDGFVSPAAADLDENAGQVRGAVSTQAAAAWLAEACHELGVETPQTERIRGRVHLPRISSADGPVLGAFVGDTPERAMKHPSPLLAVWWLPVLDPESALVRRTFDATLKRVNLDKTPTFNRPWLAAVAARMHDGERAHQLLGDLLSAPGAIVDDTCFAETQGTRWTHFLTTCGALVSAVNEMLLQSHEGDQIEVFPAVPDAWLKSEMSFENLLAKGGIRVSARWSADQMTVTLVGGPTDRQVQLSLPPRVAGEGAWQVTMDGRPISLEMLPSGGVRVLLDVPALGERRLVGE